MYVIAGCLILDSHPHFIGEAEHRLGCKLRENSGEPGRPPSSVPDRRRGHTTGTASLHPRPPAPDGRTTLGVRPRKKRSGGGRPNAESAALPTSKR